MVRRYAVTFVSDAYNSARRAIDFSYLKNDVPMQLFVDREFSSLTKGHRTACEVANERESPRVHELVFF